MSACRSMEQPAQSRAPQDNFPDGAVKGMPACLTPLRFQPSDLGAFGGQCFESAMCDRHAMSKGVRSL